MRALLCVAVALFFCAPFNAAAEELVPRTIIALYNGGDVQESYIHTLAEMPLNQLGLNVEYHDIHKPLPDIAQRKDVRGVITWFFSNTHMNADTYLKWALDAANAGKKFVVIGALGISEGNQPYEESRMAAQLLAKLGIAIQNQWVDRPFDVTYEYRTPDMFLTPSPYEWLRPPYEVVHAIDGRDRVHLMARKGDAVEQDSDLIVTGPGGGYIADGYAFRENMEDGDDVDQWLINPFEFFRLAYATDDLPKPDPTTIAGRRIYYSQIDGDGWNNVTRLEEYRGTETLAAQVIMDKAIKPYPGLPVTLSLIAADIDPAWAATKDSRAVARQFLALPQVEAGSHTYSHPFYWQFFKDGDWRKEIPYLPLYASGTWQPAADTTRNKEKPVALPVGYSTPRAYAKEPFDIHKEIEGSLKEIAPLLPEGKKVELIAWSGNCTPWEEVVRLTREAQVQNINGGDTRFDPEYPAYASVAPIGRQVGDQRQIYASSSNEITYTDLWSKNFFAQRYLKATLKNTETPMRLKPLNIYYHIFSGEREASLNALLSNLNYARTKDIAPVAASHYSRIAEGFYSTQIVALAADTWRIDNRGALQTIRFDHHTLQSVDFERSRGVIGQRHFQGSLYVYLDAAVAQPVIALKGDADGYYAPAQESTPYLVESRWLISGVTRNGSHLDFAAQGFGAGQMIWQMPAPGRYRISIDGKVEETTAPADRLLRLNLTNSAIKPLQVNISGS